MSDYAWVTIDEAADFDKLETELDPEFAPKAVIAKLQEGISNRVSGILVEREYVDKDYRSTFYKHYAKKGRCYRDDCVRLHFFEAGVAFDEATTNLASMTGSLAGQYFGFMVLRPTIHSTIGRSILSPDIRNGARGNVIQAEHEVHLLGHKLRFWGFPSMSQHADISVCAHVACWSILRHYSELHSEHREWLLYDITQMASIHDPGGLTPGLGLSSQNAKRIFQAAGTFPLDVRKQGSDDQSFYAQFLAYLESGFPLFVAMNDKGHALAAVGHSWKNGSDPKSWLNSHVWEMVDTVLTVDDNALPYWSVNRDSLSGPLPGPGLPRHTAMDFDEFIVALPEKIFYSALAVEDYSKGPLYKFLCELPNLPMPRKSMLLRRYFVTTVSELRCYARKNHSALGTNLVNLLMRLKTAQFVWVVEYASLDQWSKGQIAAMAILDATASPQDEHPVLFAHGEQLAILFDRDLPGSNYEVRKLDRPRDLPLGRMEQNLRPIRESKPRSDTSGSSA